GSQAPDPRHFGFANATLARPPESGDGLEISEAEIAQRRGIVGTAAELPMIFALTLLDRQIVDAGNAQTHQPVLVEFPVLVAVAAIPAAAVVMPLIGKTDCNTVP